METNKIGIITTSNAINYGAVLQAFALRSALYDLSHEKVEIINYSSDFDVTGRNYYSKNTGVKSLVLNCIRAFNLKYRARRHSLIGKFDDFKRNKMLIRTKLLTTKDEVEDSLDYNILVCGSDQIWNLNLFHDDVFFLDFWESHPEIKYCSYAASITERMTESQKQYIADKLKHFNLISVRENNSVEMLEKITNREVYSVLDPVYLLTPDQWISAIGEEEYQSEKKYALIFFIGHGDADQTYVDNLCEGLKKVVINLHPIKYIKGDEYICEASPMKFVSLIKNAEVVVTDSFHATSFSIIFSREFYTVKRGNRNSRTENLFKMFGISNRYIPDNSLKRSGIPYEVVRDNIELQRQKAFDYLKKIVER